MWSVKTFAWSVSGLKENLSIWENFETRNKAKHLFFSLTSKKLSHYFAFSIFLHKFANVYHVRNLIGRCRGGSPPNAECVPCGRPPMQKSAEGGDELLMRSGLTVGSIYMMKAFTWRFVLDTLKSGKFLLSSKNMATVDVHRCVITKASGVPYNYL